MKYYARDNGEWQDDETFATLKTFTGIYRAVEEIGKCYSVSPMYRALQNLHGKMDFKKKFTLMQKIYELHTYKSLPDVCGK